MDLCERTLQVHDVWIVAVFKDFPVGAQAAVRVALLRLLVQLSFQLLHLQEGRKFHISLLESTNRPGPP